MRDIRNTKSNHRALIIWMVCMAVCMGANAALADAVMPRMPSPPTTPVYWQLTSIEQVPEVSASGGYRVYDELVGLVLDLDDGLLTASLLEADDAQQGIDLFVEKNGDTLMAHSYRWSPMPIYLEPKTTYTIDVTGTKEIGEATTPNSLLGIYVQGDAIARISADGYTGHPDSASFEISEDVGLYKDGSLVVSLILRDVNDMFRNRIVFTYTMHDGAKPEPTPIPGYVMEVLPADQVPAFYVPVEGKESLWTIITAPQEYRAYGYMTGVGPYFFPASSSGTVVMDERPVDPQTDFDAYVKGFVAAEPTEPIPSHYAINEEGLYTFITRDGETVTRAFGRMDGENLAYYPADAQGTVAEDAAPVDPAEDYTRHIEGFGLSTPGTVPTHYRIIRNGLYSFTGRDGETRYRAFGRLDGAEPDYYASDAEGAVSSGTEAVDPQIDFETYIKGFDATEPDEIPSHYRIVREQLYAVDDREGSPVHRVYGVKDGAAPAFYPADADGVIAEDAVPVDPSDDFEQYVAGFVPEAPGDVPFYYDETEVPGVWTFTDKQGDAHYRAYGSLNRGEAAYYPSDASGEVARDALPVQPASDLTLMPPPVFTASIPEAAPAYYTIVEGTDGLYGMTDLEGRVLYRRYGTFGKTAPMFYPTDETGEVSPESYPLDVEKDYADTFGGFTVQTAEQVPVHYTVVGERAGLYAMTTLDNEKVYRVYGGKTGQAPAFYPADEQGNILSGVPSDPEADYEAYFGGFVPQTADTVPTHYAIVDADAGLYSSTSFAGEVVYRVFGAADGKTPAFYPATVEGRIVAGEPVDTDDEYGQLVAGFVPATPASVPTYYKIVEGKEGLYAFTDSYGVLVYRVFGAKDEQTPAFYPADAQGQPLTAVPADPQADAASLPVEVISTIKGPDATPEAASTPLVRVLEGATRWNAPTAVPFVTNINPTAAPTDPQALITKMITPEPEVTASPMPVQLVANVAQRPVEPTATPRTVTRVMDFAPAQMPTDAPTETPTEVPTEAPTETPTEVPTETPTDAATEEPTETPTDAPTEEPTETPTETPTEEPTETSTDAPTEEPTETPTETPTEIPTETPTDAPTEEPSPAPTEAPVESTGLGTGWWVAIVAAAVAALGGGGYMISKSRSKNGKKQ